MTSCSGKRPAIRHAAAPKGRAPLLTQAAATSGELKAGADLAPASPIDRPASVRRRSCWDSNARRTNAGGRHGSPRNRSRSKRYARPHDAACRIIDVLAVDCSIGPFRDCRQENDERRGGQCNVFLHFASSRGAFEFFPEEQGATLMQVKGQRLQSSAANGRREGGTRSSVNNGGGLGASNARCGFAQSAAARIQLSARDRVQIAGRASSHVSRANGEAGGRPVGADQATWAASGPQRLGAPRSMKMGTIRSPFRYRVCGHLAPAPIRKTAITFDFALRVVPGAVF